MRASRRTFAFSCAAAMADFSSSWLGRCLRNASAMSACPPRNPGPGNAEPDGAGCACIIPLFASSGLPGLLGLSGLSALSGLSGLSGCACAAPTGPSTVAPTSHRIPKRFMVNRLYQTARRRGIFIAWPLFRGTLGRRRRSGALLEQGCPVGGCGGQGEKPLFARQQQMTIAASAWSHQRRAENRDLT